MGKSRIAFRGDTRAPDEIFASGFTPRDTKNLIVYRIKHRDDEQSPYSKIHDISPESAVCLTWRMSAASYFPLYSTEDTWIYAVNVNLDEAKNDDLFLRKEEKPKEYSDSKLIFNLSKSSFVNTHGIQVLDMLAHPTRTIYRTLFADEVAVKHVESKDVLFAVNCTRILNDSSSEKGSWRHGGRYYLDNMIQVNPYRRSDLPLEIFHSTQRFLENEIKLSHLQKGIEMPLYTDGYKKNEALGVKQDSTQTKTHAVTNNSATLFSMNQPSKQNIVINVKPNKSSKLSFSTPPFSHR